MLYPAVRRRRHLLRTRRPTPGWVYLLVFLWLIGALSAMFYDEQYP
ncbi:hypothetical protein [Hymenobacter sp. GOD-10R]|nr:hypothetical protein [Hymenobacter sp. GOD-10R]WRQ29132.1 hypothetical protein SD425_02500 [Hymenobacter sp. GOD-10R]